jgi:peroxiredoxin
MILRTLPFILAAFVLLMAIVPAKAAVEIGKPAPAITAKDVNGNDFNLADHKGKIVVLEWTNRECPYVVKHYDSGNMQKLQKEARALGDVEWITINSGAAGKQGYLTADETLAHVEAMKAEPTTVIIDADGTIGKAYDAKTTPHMFVIDAEGNLAYAGAIDSDSSAKAESVETADNYVMAADTALKNGEAVETTSTAPYGCGVKY